MEKYMERSIRKYWFDAKMDYGIDGSFKSARIKDNTLYLQWIEEGIEYHAPIHNISEFTPEQVFNIWMESDWSMYAE